MIFNKPDKQKPKVYVYLALLLITSYIVMLP